jgi:hypothetical protein
MKNNAKRDFYEDIKKFENCRNVFQRKEKIFALDFFNYSCKDDETDEE